MTRSAIEASFRKLPILPSEEWRMPSVVSALVGIAEANSRPTPTQPPKAGRAAVRKQLDGISRQCNDLANALVSLSEGSIDALADAGLLQIAPSLEATLRAVSAIAQNADTDGAPKNAKGRQRNHLASGVAAVLATDYQRLTGKKPTRASYESDEYGPFYELVADIFLALCIKASAAKYAKEAIASLMEEIPE
jgi:hypothetical protein